MPLHIHPGSDLLSPACSFAPVVPHTNTPTTAYHHPYLLPHSECEGHQHPPSGQLRNVHPASHPGRLCSALLSVTPEQRAHLAGKPAFWSTEAAAGLGTSVEVAAIVLHRLQLLAHGAKDPLIFFSSCCIHHTGVCTYL